MTQEEFVREFYLLRKSLLGRYFNPTPNTEVGKMIMELKVDNDIREEIKQIISASLGDALYTVLLGLDGAARIGDQQISYRIFDEEENELSGGEIEGYAYEYFHNNNY